MKHIKIVMKSYTNLLSINKDSCFLFLMDSAIYLTAQNIIQMDKIKARLNASYL